MSARALYLLAAGALLAALAACGGSPPGDVALGVGSGRTLARGEMPLDPPPIGHGQPEDELGQMCVVCHTCGSDGTLSYDAPLIDRGHFVCRSCHRPDGSTVHHSGGQCVWRMDCEADPPSVNCSECHTATYVNDLCRHCHCR